MPNRGFPTTAQKYRQDILFKLKDGTPVYYGDILWHPDRRRVGWACRAEFSPQGKMVTVRALNGAVPHVAVSELRSEPPPERRRCRACGQTLPQPEKP